MRAIGIIPARYASSRFPGKPLAEIGGRTMIEHVYQRAAQASSLAEVWVATDDLRIQDAVKAFGGNVVMTRDNHASGTDRIAEAAAALRGEVIVNVQGDEPLLDPHEIDAVVEPFRSQPGLAMSTLAVPISDPCDIEDPGVVKVVTDAVGFALYFSRLPIPYYRASAQEHATTPRLKHIGLYAYSREFLFRYAAMPPSSLEQAEALEQLRALEAGHRIYVVRAKQEAGEDRAISVDTPEDLERVRRLYAATQAGS